MVKRPCTGKKQEDGQGAAEMETLLADKEKMKEIEKMVKTWVKSRFPDKKVDPNKSNLYYNPIERFNDMQ